MNRACAGTTKKGKPCSRPVEVDGFCLFHQPDLEKRREFMRSLQMHSIASQNAAREDQREALAEEISLSTVEEIRAYLEREASASRATADPPRGTAAARVAKEARELLVAERLQTENRELKALLLERHPELKSQLRVAK